MRGFYYWLLKFLFGYMIIGVDAFKWGKILTNDVSYWVAISLCFRIFFVLNVFLFFKDKTDVVPKIFLVIMLIHTLTNIVFLFLIASKNFKFPKTNFITTFVMPLDMTLGFVFGFWTVNCSFKNIEEQLANVSDYWDVN